MEYKFKKGDVVERTDDFSSEMPLGSQWIVVGYNYGGWLNLEGSVNTDGQYHGWEQLNFKLIQKSEDAAKGVKYDSDKPEASLLPKGVLTSVIKVLGFGSKKYSKDNWQKVDNHKERYYNAAQRHITQWWEGEKYDKETGENHLAHAICCLMFMLWFDNQEDKKEDNK